MQDAVYTFMEEFVPHMEEEETTFQPLLSQYFQYEELKQLKVNLFIIWDLIVPDLEPLCYVQSRLPVRYRILRVIAADPGSGAFLTPGSGKGKKSRSGSTKN